MHITSERQPTGTRLGRPITLVHILISVILDFESRIIVLSLEERHGVHSLVRSDEGFSY